MKEYFMQTNRIGFSIWQIGDLELATQLWGDPDVTKYICATGKFMKKDIISRLETEVQNHRQFGIQYWPIFSIVSEELIGCCGLRPFKDEKDVYEMGFHLCKNYWGKGYATEGAKAVSAYAFEALHAKKIFVGHHPENLASKKVLAKLGFSYIGKNYYEPTGLFHPSYELLKVNTL